MFRKLCFLFVWLSISSCKTSVTLEYDITDGILSGLSAEVRVSDIEERNLKYVVPVIQASDEIDGVDYAVFVSQHKTIILYASKKFRYGLVREYGSVYEIVKRVQFKIVFQNKTTESKTFVIDGAWVNGEPTSSGNLEKFRVEPGGRLEVEIGEVKIADVLENGFVTVAFISK